MTIKDRDLLNENITSQNENDYSEFDKMFDDAINEGKENEGEETTNEENIPEEETTNEEEKEEETQEEGGEEEQTETPEEEQTETPEEEQTEQEGELDEETMGIIEDILKEAEDIGGEKIDEAAQDVQDAIDNGEDKDEILAKIAELEEALANESLEKESYKKEKEKLLEKINELQDKLSEYEIKGYEFGVVEKALNEDPELKGFVKILAYNKLKPDVIKKEQVIDALDKYTRDEFGVGIKDLLSEKVKQQNEAMTAGKEHQPIEINISTDDEKDPIDKMLGI